jgi:TP901 family phage tail tape measure protein
MADDIRSDIIINVDTSVGIAEIKNLQRQISQLNAQLLKSGAQQAQSAQNIQRNLINNINATGKFSANVRTISTTAESFTTALEKNKLSMGEYFRYAGASTKTFGRLFKKEFSTIEKVGIERVKTLQTQYIKLGRDGSGAMKAIAVRPLTLDMNNLATKTALAAQKQQLFNQLLKQGSTNLLNFGKNTQWAGRQLMVGFSIPLAYLGAVAGKTFMKMEEQAIRFKRVYGDSFTATEETDKMMQQVKDLAQEFTKYGVAVEKTMGMAADAAAMGLVNADLLAQITESTRLAVLGGVEQEKALDTTISLMNAFGTSAENLASDIDFLNAVENQTVTAIEDLTIAIPKAAPVVKQLGGNVKDLAFFLTAMKEGGINASEGANALKSGLASLINPSEKSAKFLANLGININSIVEGNAGDIKGTVIDFARALDTLDPLNRARAIEQLFGKFQFSRLSTLFQNVIKEGTQAQRVLDLTASSTAELAILSERELRRVEDSPMFKFKKAVEDLKVSLVPLGEAFIKAITPVIEFAKGFLDRFNQMGEGAKSFAVLVTTVVAGIGPVLLMTFGLVANGVANLIKLFSSMSGIFQGAGKSSTDLGLSTEYMTQQQLEAAAVASSLDQSHSKLIQTFNVESAAVDRLAQAYARAVVAQSRLLNVPIGPKNPGGQRPLKLNSGIVSVPGPKGAGDIVPAMLSPGEAVIPAKQSRKYSGIIQGMINDEIPGYRIGRNPFASLLRSSRVATRMKSSELKSMLQSGDLKYRSAFETKTGADFTRFGGSTPNPYGVRVRQSMENDVLGIPRNAPSSARPTYGSVELTAFGRIISKIFGLRGKQFRSIAGPNNRYLDMYGDASLVGKKSLGKRSSVFAGDLLANYRNNPTHYVQKRSALGASPSENLLPPMYGATKDQLERSGRFSQFSSPFGKPVPSGGKSLAANPGSPYIEAQVAGGFSLKDVSKIRVPSRSDARQIQKLVDKAGLKIRVTPQNAPAVIKALANIFGTRFNGGSLAIHRSHLQKPLDPKDADIASQLSKKLPGYSKMPEDIRSRMLFSGSLTADLSESMNQSLRGGRLSVSDFESRWSSSQNKLLSTSMSALGKQQLSPAEIKAIASIENKIGKEAVKLAKNGYVTDSVLANATKKVLLRSKDMAGLQGSLAKGLLGRSAVLGDYRTNYTKRELQELINSGKAIVKGSAIIEPNSGLYLGRISKTRGPKQVTRHIPGGYARQLKFGAPGGTQAMPAGKAQPKKPKSTVSPKVAAPKGSQSEIPLSSILQGGSRVGSPVAASRAGMLAKIFGRKYANGVVSVPGPKGAGDVVPAMLSPGEAVIPAKESKKYAPLINSMISDSVPGYSTGKGIPGFDSSGMPLKPSGTPANPYANQIQPIQIDQSSAQQAGETLGKTAFSPKRIVEGVKSVGKGVADKAIIASTNILSSNGRGGVSGVTELTGGKVYDPESGKTFSSYNDYAKNHERNEAIRVARKPGTSYINSRGVLQTFDEGGKARASSGGAAALKAQQQGQSGSPKGTDKPKGKISGAVGSAASIAGMGAMMYGMSGGPGAEIASMVAMPLMMLPMLANPIAGTIAAIAALVAGIWLLKTRLDDATKSGLATGEAMAMTSKKLDKLSEFTGKVTASQEAERIRSDQLSGSTAMKRQFGQNFMESEAGADLLNQSKSLISQGVTGSELADNLANQLSYAVLQGAVTTEQARSIAIGLGEKLGNYSIGVKIAGELTSLLGFNGENLKDNPLQVAMAIQRESVAEAADSFETALDGIAENTANDFVNNARMAAGSAITAGALAIGASIAIGSAGILSPLGAAIAGVGSAIGGLTALPSLLSEIGDEEENNKLRGVATQLGAEQLAQNQGILDSVRKQYDSQIAGLEAKKAAATKDKDRLILEKKINQKITERDAALEQVRLRNNKIYDDLLKNAASLGTGFNTAIEKSIDARFENATGAVKEAVGLAKAALGELPTEENGKFNNFKATLQLGLASGEFDPISVINLLNASKENPNIKFGFEAVIKATGSTADANQLLQLLAASSAGTETYGVIFDFMVRNKEDFQYNLEALAQISNMNQEYGIEIIPTVKNIEDVGNFIEQTKDLDAGKPLTKEIVLDYLRTGKDSDGNAIGMSTLKDLQDMVNNWDTLTGGSNKLDYQVMVDFVIGKSSDAAMQAWFMANNPKRWQEMIGSGPMVADRKSGQIDADENAEIRASFFGANKPEDKPKDKKKDEDDPEDTGSTTDPLDAILTRLKQIREASVNATGGLKELDKWLGGNKNMKQFVGIEQQLRKMGKSAEFINFVKDLDIAEQKKYFAITSKGIIKVTKDGQNLQKTFSEIALGDFQSSMGQNVIDSNNQATAFKKLIAGGMSYADALDAVSDNAFAAAVASKSFSSKELKEVTASAKRAETALKRITAINAKVSLRTAIDDEDVKGTIRRNFFRNTNTKFDELEQFAIQEDSVLSQTYLDFVSGKLKSLPEEFGQRLNQIISDPEFREKFFNTAFGMASEAFSVLEKEIQLDFELGLNESGYNEAKVNVSELRAEIAEAENQIAGINFKIDDLEAGLTKIAEEEDKINEAYDKKFEALEKIEKANDAIIRQQKSQLNLADALSQGDIAAAARAAQEMRSESASGSIQSQREMLERSQEMQLRSLVTTVNGEVLTREQIEKRIKSFQKEIFDIEENTLEIKQNQVREAQFLIDKAVRGLEVAGLTRTEWEKQQNLIEKAKISADGYLAVLEAAKLVVGGIVADWKILDGKVVTTTHIIKTVDMSGPGTDPYNIMQNSELAKANPDYFNDVVLPNIASGTATSSEITDYVNAVNDARGLPLDTPVAMSSGGSVKRYAQGGHIPRYLSAGGRFKPLGTDTVPAMLTPGEFVVRKYAVDNFGVDKLKSINSGTYNGDSMYNYEVNINVQTGANPDQIARAVMGQIRQVESQRIRGNRF